MTSRNRSAMSRRKAFKEMLGRFIVMFDEARGQQHIPLKQIEQLDRTVLEKLIPVRNRVIEIFRNDNWLMVLHPETGEKARLFETTDEKMFFFRMVNGRHTLLDLSSAIINRFDWEEKRAWALVKQVFLNMLKHGVLSIVNIPEELMQE